jgi:aspartyl-tRNA synthetase
LISVSDDGIVVQRSRNGRLMQRLRVVPALRQTLGDDGAEALTDMVFTAAQHWRDDVLNALENRFDKRLTQEIGALRADVITLESRFEKRLTQEITALRVDVTKDLAAMRVENLRWSFVFWISQLGAMAGLLSYFK